MVTVSMPLWWAARSHSEEEAVVPSIAVNVARGGRWTRRWSGHTAAPWARGGEVAPVALPY